MLDVIVGFYFYQELGKEFVKCLKVLLVLVYDVSYDVMLQAGLACVTAVILSPFSIALAMSVAQIQRFEDQVRCTHCKLSSTEIINTIYV